jgi:hypothetical protein
MIAKRCVLAKHCKTRKRSALNAWGSAAVSGALALGLGCQGKLVTLGQSPPGALQAVDAGSPDTTHAPGASSTPAPTSAPPAPDTTGTPSASSTPTPSTPSAPASSTPPAPTAPPVPSFGPPTLITELGSEGKDDNPTLTADLREIYFTSTRNDEADVWFAQRDSVDEPFAEPVLVAEVNSADFESSPAVALDGLTLWVGSRREGGLGGVDIWVSRRENRDQAWSTPEPVAELNSEQDDIPRPLGDAERRMPLGSRRDNDYYLTYIAERGGPDEAFSPPVLLSELVVDGASTADAFLLADGTGLLLVHSVDERGDVYFAARQGDNFAATQPLDSLNTEFDERDPWLSPDGQTLFFASDRGGSLQIYQATRTP